MSINNPNGHDAEFAAGFADGSHVAAEATAPACAICGDVWTTKVKVAKAGRVGDINHHEQTVKKGDLVCPRHWLPDD